MQNDECKMQNNGMPSAWFYKHREAIPQFCILNFAFCILHLFI